ncbi:Dyp-type peroxidase [Streptomyces sp. URMC 123]|uniref:Dyp-type peroxidase n=1 Tax=Streptomyces sp. URMC 123 TaxID=3423403 RepID=UPI003F1BD3F8
MTGCERGAVSAGEEQEGAGRRGFLKGAIGAVGAAAAGVGAGASPAWAAERPGPGGTASRPGRHGGGDGPSHIEFHGPHQAGVLTPQQHFAAFLAFEVLTEDRKGLEDLFKELTSRSRDLTAGITPPNPDVAAIPGPADRLTVTLGVGASLFDGRFGLERHKPRRLRPMRAFPHDKLEPEWCHGDLSLQICAEYRDAVVHVVRDLAKATDGALKVRWRAEGFINPPRPVGSPRTFVGFKDGISNPDRTSVREMDQLVWVTPDSDEPEWAAGGCYQVIRTIKIQVEPWDKVPVNRQEKMIGRFKTTGAPLDGEHETDTPDYRRDPEGELIPLNAHIRLANPRTPATDDSRILRRSYSYDNGFRDNGGLDLGLIFVCYQQDVVRQFETVQKRLVNEPMTPYITPFGGGYFFVLPGVEGPDDWYGSGLMRAR